MYTVEYIYKYYTKNRIFEKLGSALVDWADSSMWDLSSS